MIDLEHPRISEANQFRGMYWTHLLVKPLDPALQILQLLGLKILAIVERAIKVLGQHLLVEALTSQTPRGIATREVLVGTTGAVEVAPARHVIHFALDCEIHRRSIFAVVWEESSWCECAEDDRLGGVRNGRWCGGLETVVEEGCDDREEEDV